MLRVIFAALSKVNAVEMDGGAQDSTVDVTFDEQAYVDHLTLHNTEVFWRNHQVWLAERGYMLRPRYRPGWVPSWKDTGKDWGRFEDGQAIGV